MYRGVGKGGGQGGRVPSEIATVKFFPPEQYGISDNHSYFQRIFQVSESFAPDPTRGMVPAWTALVTEPTLFSPPKQIPRYAPVYTPPFMPGCDGSVDVFAQHS